MSEDRSEADDRRVLLFLHEVGDADGPRRWRALGTGASGPGGHHRWPGAVLVPDLPGHGVVPPEEGAYYAPGDVALVGVRALAAAGLDGEAPVVGGHGWGAFGAELLAAGGRASALVLVDGLGGPWVSRSQLIDVQHAWLRAGGPNLLCMGLFSRFCVQALCCIAEGAAATRPYSRLIATISLPVALIRAMASFVFSITVAM